MIEKQEQEKQKIKMVVWILEKVMLQEEKIQDMDLELQVEIVKNKKTAQLHLTNDLNRR